MKRILVSLVSEQPIPNILVAAQYKPADFWFISTERMERERKSECLENTLKLMKLLSPGKVVEKIIVDQDSLTDCMSKIERLIENAGDEVEYIVNITGGNKVMALSAYEIFREIGQRVVIDYMPLGKNEIVQIFPRKKPIRVVAAQKRLNLEEYLCSYGFTIQNKNNLEKIKMSALTHRDNSLWILNNYKQLKGILGFLYKYLGEKRGEKRYSLAETFDRDLAELEKEFLNKHGFAVKDRFITKELAKDEIVYLTGGWFEEYAFLEAFDLANDIILDDAMIGIKIESTSGTSNDLDIAFMKDNAFYHIECKTLGDEEDQNIIREEVYKKGVISTLLGKGEKRAIICTTNNQIKESLLMRANDYGVEIFNREQCRNLKKRLKEKFNVPH